MVKNPLLAGCTAQQIMPRIGSRSSESITAYASILGESGKDLQRAVAGGSSNPQKPPIQLSRRSNCSCNPNPNRKNYHCLFLNALLLLILTAPSRSSREYNSRFGLHSTFDCNKSQSEQPLRGTYEPSLLLSVPRASTYLSAQPKQPGDHIPPRVSAASPLTSSSAEASLLHHFYTKPTN